MKNRRVLLPLLIFFFAIFFQHTSFATDACDVPIVEHPPIAVRQVMQPRDLEKYIERVETESKLSNAKAKGVAGEVFARQEIEAGAIGLGANRLTSIMTMFKNNGCNVSEYLRNSSDNGIDDIFVVVDKKTGWIDRRFSPVFHEAKYNGKCGLKLASTKALCDQLSVVWVTKNLEIASRRTGAASVCFGDQNKLVIQSCEACKTQFQENLIWLADQLKDKKFSRTASVLCANGKLRIHIVK